MNTLSERLKRRRTELNLTQADLAVIAGVKQQTIQQIESGSTKRPRFLLEIASALECTHLGCYMVPKVATQPNQ